MGQGKVYNNYFGGGYNNNFQENLPLEKIDPHPIFYF